MKITDYASISAFTEDNILLVDGNSGTKKITVGEAMLGMLHLLSVKNHKTVFRGKNLGTSLTSAQKAAIQAGTFEDLWLGDYWVINGINWRIVDFDYWYNSGDTKFTKHHLVIMPDKGLYLARMNNTGTTVSGGYANSDMRTKNLANARNTVSSAFGNALLTHREYLSDAESGGHVTSAAWYDSDVDIPNEIMIYGCNIMASGTDGSSLAFKGTNSYKQLALFRTTSDFRSNMWLRDISAIDRFTYEDSSGIVTFGQADYQVNVRPVFAIG